MANTLVTPTWVMKEIGRRLVNNLKFANNVGRSYDDQYVVQGAKVGYTVNARLPQRYQVNKGQALTVAPVTDSIVPITLTDQANIGLEFSTASLTMEVNDYKTRYIAPAVDALVNAVDYDGLNRMYKSVFMTVGTPQVVPGSTGTLPGAANLVYLGAGVKLSNAAVPTDGRIAILNPNMHAYLASANMTLFNPTGSISEAFKSGMFGREALGISEWYSDQNVATHTVGAVSASTALVNTPTTLTANGATSVVSNGWSSGTLNQGDVIQFASVYAINPLNYQSTGQLMDFVVTATTSDSSGDMTIPIYPAMTFSGANAVCSNTPANDDAITTFGHATSYSGKVTPQGLVYHPDAFALVMADLEMPGGVWVSERISNKALGVSIRFVKDYNVMSDQSPARVDVLYGWKAVRPELACRVCS